VPACGLHFGTVTLFTHIRHQSHEASPFDRVFYRALESCAIAAAFPTKEFALACTHFFQALHILVIDKGRTGTSFFRAKPAAILATTPKLLAHHRKRPRSTML